MKRNEMTTAELLLEAVGIVSAILYLGLQIYYWFVYGVKATVVMMNMAVMILVYTGLTLLAIHPEKVNGLSREVCTGAIRKYTVRMLRLMKLTFVGGLLFTSICDVMGHEVNEGYSLVVVVLVVVIAVVYESKIIRILRERRGK